MALFEKEAQGTLKYGNAQEAHKNVAIPVSAKSQQPHKTISTPVTTPSSENYTLNSAKDAVFGLVAFMRFVQKILNTIWLIFLGITVFMLLLIGLISYAAANSNAATTNGTASATVVRDVFTSSCTPLSFGSVSSKSSAGLVMLTPKGKRSAYGLVSLGNANFQPSRCDISGPTDTSYHVKVPSVVEFTITPNEETPPPRTSPLTFQEKFKLALKGKLGTPDSTLRVSGIKVYSENKRASNATGKTDKNGRDALLLGATLHVSMNTLPGVYQGIIPVTVMY